MSPLYRSLQGSAILVALLTLVFAAPPAQAHSDAHLALKLNQQGASFEGSMHMELRDLKHMLPQSDANTQHSPESLRAQLEVFESYLNKHMRMQTIPQGERCPLRLQGLHMPSLSAVRLAIRFDCPSLPNTLKIEAGLFRGASHAHHYHLDVKLRGPDYEVEHFLDERNNRSEFKLGKAEPPRSLALTISIGLIFVGLAVFVGVFVLSRSRRKKNVANGNE